jgi:hypothetical protein
MKQWRPEGWDAAKELLIANMFTNPDRQRYLDGYEAGANAMLKGLKVLTKQPNYYEDLQQLLLSRKGTLVFIPDDDPKEGNDS